MANVTQQIPNFLGGYSQKPDFEKPLNCVSSLVNGYPDVTAGLSKRPGTVFINKLALASNTLPEDYKWFNIEHNNESYIGAVGKNTLKVWKTETGQECTVVTTNAATNYLAVDTSYNIDAYSTFKTATFEKATIICNTSVTVAASSTTNTGITLSNHYEENSLADLQSGSTGTPGTDVFTIKNTNTDKDDIFVQWDGYTFAEVLGYDTIDGSGNPVPISVGLDNNTLPHILEVTGTSGGLPTWEVKKVNYANRSAGNNITNPQPSFVGLKINNIFTYLNRIGFLSGSNVIMSRPITPDNTTNSQSSDVDFYFKSTFAVSDADPIDINVATTTQLRLHSVAKSREGLVLFSDLEQLLLYSENGIITPNSVDVRGLSNWSSDPNINSIPVGDDIYFVSGVSPYNKYSRLIRMIPQGVNGTPIFDEVSKDVSEWLPLKLTSATSGSQEQVLILSKNNSNTMYVYRAYKRGGEAQMAAWFEWKFEGDVQWVFIRNSTLYFIIEFSGSAYLQKMSLQVTTVEDVVGGDNKRPYLDMIETPQTVTSDTITPTTNWFSDPHATAVAYVTDTSTVSLSGPIDIGETGSCTGTYQDLLEDYDALEGGSIIDLLDGDTITDAPDRCYSLRNGADNVYDLLGGTDSLKYFGYIAGYTVDLVRNSNGTYTSPVDLSANDIIIGYKYNLDITLPKFYFRQNNLTDYTAFTTISRLKFTAHITGATKFLIQSLGRPDWNTALEVTDAGFYEADVIPIAKENMFELPIHRRNDQFSIRVQSDSPYPVTLNSMMWEGQYLPRSYRRL